MQETFIFYIKAKLHSASTWLELLGVAVLGFSSWLFGADLSSHTFHNWPAWTVDLLQTYRDHLAFWFVWATGAILFALGFIGQRVRSPKDWAIIQYLLNKAQEIAYPNNQKDPKHCHRVTLFRHQRWAYVRHWSSANKNRLIKKIWPWGDMAPWSGWLVPVKRSAHTSQISRTRFSARPDGSSEGVCGKAWSQDSMEGVQDLPLVRSKKSANRQKYADLSNCPKEMIDFMMDGTGERKIAPMSIGAIPIRVKGVLWGVLVFDSQAPKGVKQTLVEDFRILVDAIEQILEK